MAQDKLKEALNEIQFLKNEVQEECNKRRNAERELHSALQKVCAVLVKIQIACLFINEIIGTFVDQRTGEILYGWVKAAEGTPGDA